MYTTCPKCAYVRREADTAPAGQCPACGLVFSKWLKAQMVDTAVKPAASLRSPRQALLQYCLPPRPQLTGSEWLILVIVWGAFLVCGLYFINLDFRSNAIGNSWFHNINLVFHEAGHVLFRPGGRTAMLLGGSLFQVLLPLLLMGCFLQLNRDAFGASLCLWWAGQSLMDVAPYIADARALRLPLLGVGAAADSPGMHDWANLLRPRGWLRYDTTIAFWVDLAGTVLVLLALLWGAAALWRYRRDLRTRG